MLSVTNGDVIVHVGFSFLGVVWMKALKRILGVGSLGEIAGFVWAAL